MWMEKLWVAVLAVIVSACWGCGGGSGSKNVRVGENHWPAAQTSAPWFVEGGLGVYFLRLRPTIWCE
jgi:hypothetical protein